MSFRGTAALLSKASRMPLTSKQGNKDFYKGTGSLPGFGRKRAGRHSIRSKAPYILMPERMRTFVVPEIEPDCALKPFVSKNVDPRETAKSWPIANTKRIPETRRGGIYSNKGFDGAYYLQIARLKNGNMDDVAAQVQQEVVNGHKS